MYSTSAARCLDVPATYILAVRRHSPQWLCVVLLTGGAVAQVGVRGDVAQGVGAHAGEPHVHAQPLRQDRQAVRPDPPQERLHRELQVRTRAFSWSSCLGSRLWAWWIEFRLLTCVFMYMYVCQARAHVRRGPVGVRPGQGGGGGPHQRVQGQMMMMDNAVPCVHAEANLLRLLFARRKDPASHVVSAPSACTGG